MVTLRESRAPALGRQHSYEIAPALLPGCRAEWRINGVTVLLHDTRGGLAVKGFGAAGSMTVEMVADVSLTTVGVVIHCEGKPEVEGGPMEVGSGVWGNPNALAFPTAHWPWWRRLLGFCPEEWIIDGVPVKCKHYEGLSGLWPFSYTIRCRYPLPPPAQGFTVLEWTLRFGSVTKGPR